MRKLRSIAITAFILFITFIAAILIIPFVANSQGSIWLWQKPSLGTPTGGENLYTELQSGSVGLVRKLTLNDHYNWLTSKLVVWPMGNCKTAKTEAELIALKDDAEIVVVQAPITLTPGSTLTTTCALYGTRGCPITTTGATLTINGPFEAGPWQAFSGTGTVTGLKEARPEWWGGLVGTDSSTAFQAALTSLSSGGTFIADGVGTYTITTGSTIATNGIRVQLGQSSRINAPANITIFTISAGVTGTRFSGGKITGSVGAAAADFYSQGKGIVTYGIDTTVENVEFYGLSRAVHLDTSQSGYGLVVDKCNFHKMGYYSVWIGNSLLDSRKTAKARITNCTFDGTELVPYNSTTIQGILGINMEYAEDVIILANTVTMFRGNFINNSDQATDVGYIVSDITISNNQFLSSTALSSGCIELQHAYKVKILGNTFIGGARVGVQIDYTQVAFATDKTYNKNINISNNTFESTFHYDTSTTRNALQLQNMDSFNVSNNIFIYNRSNLSTTRLDYAMSIVSCQNGVIVNNDIDGTNIAFPSTPTKGLNIGIAVGRHSVTCRSNDITIVSNRIRNTTAGYETTYSDDVSVDRIYSKDNIGPTLAGQYYSTGKNVVWHYTATPSTKTWAVGDTVLLYNQAAAGNYGYYCVTAGTMGTLTGVTADTTNGSPVITVNSATNLREGHWITVAGTIAKAQILSISGTSVTVSSNATGDTTGAATSFFAAEFKTFGVIDS